MTSVSSRALPFIVMAILAGTIGLEAAYDIDIDLESYLPLLVAVGIGGAAKSAITKAAQARSTIPSNIEDKIKEEIRKIIPKQ